MINRRMKPERARSLRQRAGFGVVAWAERCNVTRQTIYNWESGRYPLKGAACRLYEVLERGGHAAE